MTPEEREYLTALYLLGGLRAFNEGVSAISPMFMRAPEFIAFHREATALHGDLLEDENSRAIEKSREER